MLLSCFTPSAPVSKTRSSPVNITVRLWLPRLNTIYSWASSISFSYHSDLVWTGTSGYVVRSCKYPASESSLEFLVFAEYSFSNLSAQPTVQTSGKFTLCCDCNLWAEHCVPPRSAAFCAAHRMQPRLSRLPQKPTLWTRLGQIYVKQCNVSQEYTGLSCRNVVSFSWVLCLHNEQLFGVCMCTRLFWRESCVEAPSSKRNGLI